MIYFPWNYQGGIMLKKAIYAGTFDPFTNGHDNILQRAARIFDEVTVLLATSPSKKPILEREERFNLLGKHLEQYKNVKLDQFDGLVVDYAKKNNIGSLVRGLRPTGDFEVEFQMAAMNKELSPELETVFLMTEGDNYFVSSSLVREILAHGGDIRKFVPEQIYKGLKK